MKAVQKKLLLFKWQMKIYNSHHFPLLKEFKKCNHYIKYPKEIRKIMAAFESRFSNLELDKYRKMFAFHVEIKSALEYIQMKLVDLQSNIEWKHIFEKSESKMDFYNNYVIKEKFPKLRNLVQKVVSTFGSTYTYKSFFLSEIDQKQNTLNTT